jgi:hypothetical protein
MSKTSKIRDREKALNSILGGSAMKIHFRGFLVLSIALIFLAVASRAAEENEAGLLDYEVISVDPAGWIVTAKEMESGQIVKFRLPPAVFHGKTFDADLSSLQVGQLFSVQGQKNVHMHHLQVEQPLPGEALTKRALKAHNIGAEGGVLTWEILNVNPRQWTAPAKNRSTQKIIKIKVIPEAFVGFLFRANLRGIKKGESFTLVTPNDVPMANCCRLLELPK